MIREDYHVHTVFDDGKNTPEEVVLEAIRLGMTTLGFSGHSPLPMQNDWTMTEQNAGEFRREIARLQKKYEGQLRILCGVEQDFISVTGTEEYAYVIGSVHSVPAPDGTELEVDHAESIQRQAVQTCFDGDFYAFAEAYYERVAHVVEKTHCDIIGHFDLVSKFNEGGRLFDESHPRYVAAWKSAADALLETGVPFEINSGAVSRGYRTEPYPALPILQYLKQHGAKLILSSDSHSAKNLCFRFAEMEQLL